MSEPQARPWCDHGYTLGCCSQPPYDPTAGSARKLATPNASAPPACALYVDRGARFASARDATDAREYVCHACVKLGAFDATRCVSVREEKRIAALDASRARTSTETPSARSNASRTSTTPSVVSSASSARVRATSAGDARERAARAREYALSLTRS